MPGTRLSVLTSEGHQAAPSQSRFQIVPQVIDTRIGGLHHMLFKETFTQKQLHPHSSMVSTYIPNWDIMLHVRINLVQNE